MSEQEHFDIALDPKELNIDWDKATVDEEELLEAGYPLALLVNWIENNIIAPFSVENSKRHFYTKEVFKATVYHVMSQKAQDDDKKVMD
ncbi:MULTISPECIES: hypothetical protein [Staphylococcus]|uniref:Uncharacterized protein n=2 Tax=Staphylococcus TaxID=1279 RepID=A0A2K4FAK3_9STAP|nr:MULTISPECIES: hypothetical protein [Staphylococcus]EHM68081.1 hypothetical protein SEVCU012_1612 [Staphylococcus pettenkoferi VCU012]MBX8994089.1 hypothetical protein [Staphylococcus pettenkoferi]MCI2803627.1 hypothetical protein [Staphylococcus pettenkoferi]MCY1565189.1 hypothetical protein [Staphylococcus pettenkoferi]MCY1567119.1 hypothetical protein [Staphylococcus pettenkoferi]